ncbi:S-methyl-5'-thioinosine phosphorylase [Arenimonas sp. GDDSR-1]|uniref:S-methyl-5'-thioinosine phosphorylase n=1 Tax=Arenimonas sp. GDDSR-1 TaxID=2950125 RepID=UPI00262B8C32|nr:S-methyl-5'-thioinosine phosphorylase [Arenimonas sp. GDDSR-1]
MNEDIALAVIGGTGVYRLPGVQWQHSHTLQTRFGAPSGPIRTARIGSAQVAFLARHGEGHALPPHQINYRANLQALHDLGVRRVLAINTVGGIGAAYGPRVLAVPDQIIDYTWGRISTLCEEPGSPVLHVDFGDPYTESLRLELLAACKAAGVDVVAGGCYGATQGPRLESKAEIARLGRDGCDLVGMTGMPEAGLAREFGLSYASLCVVANWAAGCDPANAEITLEEVLANVESVSGHLLPILEQLLAS